jgi:hypothetical protein
MDMAQLQVEIDQIEGQPKRVVPTGVQGSPSELNFFTTYGGIEPRTLRSS